MPLSIFLLLRYKYFFISNTLVRKGDMASKLYPLFTISTYISYHNMPLFYYLCALVITN